MMIRMRCVFFFFRVSNFVVVCVAFPSPPIYEINLIYIWVAFILVLCPVYQV